MYVCLVTFNYFTMYPKRKMEKVNVYKNNYCMTRNMKFILMQDLIYVLIRNFPAFVTYFTPLKGLYF